VWFRHKDPVRRLGYGDVVTSAEAGSRPLVVVNPSYFSRTLPPTAMQLVSVDIDNFESQVRFGDTTLQARIPLTAFEQIDWPARAASRGSLPTLAGWPLRDARRSSPSSRVPSGRILFLGSSKGNGAASRRHRESLDVPAARPVGMRRQKCARSCLLWPCCY